MLEPTRKIVRLRSEEVQVKLVMLLGTKANCCKAEALMGAELFGGIMEYIKLFTVNLSHSREMENWVFAVIVKLARMRVTSAIVVNCFDEALNFIMV